MRIIKPVVFILCLLPVIYLATGIFLHQLGANPLEEFIRRCGEWALRFLLLTLTMTPLRYILCKSWPLRFRRMFGLFTFFYVCVHLLAYLWFDQFFDWGEIWRDIVKRPFITVGMLSWLILLVLTITSFASMKKYVGKYWKKLHRSTYMVAGLVLLHYFWLVKADLYWPSFYTLLFIVLMAYRLFRQGPSKIRQVPSLPLSQNISVT